MNLSLFSMALITARHLRLLRGPGRGHLRGLAWVNAICLVNSCVPSWSGSASWYQRWQTEVCLESDHPTYDLEGRENLCCISIYRGFTMCQALNEDTLQTSGLHSYVGLKNSFVECLCHSMFSSISSLYLLGPGALFTAVVTTTISPDSSKCPQGGRETKITLVLEPHHISSSW